MEMEEFVARFWQMSCCIQNAVELQCFCARYIGVVEDIASGQYMFERKTSMQNTIIVKSLIH